jgi:transcriptional regulator
MFVQPWDAALDDAEWQTWIEQGHDFGQLTVNGLPGYPPAVVPTHFSCDGPHLLDKYQARGPVIDRTSYKATVSIDILTPADP